MTRVLNVNAGGHPVLRNLTIANGFADNVALHGGGLNMSGSTAEVENCLFVDNISSETGGGIYSSSGTLTVTNSTFSNNRANTFGGAVATAVAGGLTVTLQHCTVTGNVGDEDNNTTGGGGGLAGMSGNPNELQIKSTLVAENIQPFGSTGPTCSLPSLRSDTISWATTRMPLSCIPPGLRTRTTTMSARPHRRSILFLDRCKTTEDRRSLACCSAAVSRPIKASATCLATDQRLQPRTFNFTSIANASGGDGTDIGAVERGNTAPVAADNATSTNEDTPLVVAAPGVLTGDTDADSDPLTAALVTVRPTPLRSP